jgi:hypothetical protein
MSRATAAMETRSAGVGGGSLIDSMAAPGKRTLVDGLAPGGVPAVSGGSPMRDREPDGAAAAAQAAPQQATTSGGPAGSETPTPATQAPAGVRDAPTATYVVPFDRNPLAAPGERIICVAEFTGGTDADYEIAYSTAGGHFSSAAGPTTLTVQGLRSGNVNFFVPTPWNGTDAVTVTMQLKKKSDSSVVKTETWTYGKKTYYPTTMTQREGVGEVALPGIYNYDIGPARPTGTAPFYQHQTILERFDNWSVSNIAPADIAEAYRTAHGLTSAAAITTHFIGAYAGDNGTFTVNANDRVADQHGGQPNVDKLVANLVTPKVIEVALPQTYEAQPGTALANFMVTRVRKTDGTWMVKKAPR